MLVTSGIVMKGKKRQVELWRQPPKPKTKATGSFHTPTNTPAKRKTPPDMLPRPPQGEILDALNVKRRTHAVSVP